VVTNTIPLGERASKSKRIQALSVSGIFAEAIKRVYERGSVSELFLD